ncbi:hypothetical protein [Spirosoma sp. KNUC1025]|uniref:hypothetical protein n=1 Tax=Spirosoma sp. KNUC1025 TaxID=2894082 RepID=UPI003865C4AC|nr:hypothetical protein LN737_01290 [Spirosoma sp. KNUC1025]
MLSHILTLQVVQAERSLLKSKNNNYSDREKKDYHNKLSLLLDYIKNEINNQNDYTNSFCFGIKKELDFIFKSLEFLDSSTLNLIPYETVECLNLALKDWIKPKESYIIVTSLINNTDRFSFDPSLIEDTNIYETIHVKYGIKFEHKLIQLNIPKSLSRDYLINVVHYHELGHFIDINYSISDPVAWEIVDKWLRGDFKNKQRVKILKYFPSLEHLDADTYIDSKEFDNIKSFLREYFSDLFASQYVGKCFDNYIMYLDEESDQDGIEHPSASKRSEVVNAFLKNERNIIVTMLNKSIKNVLSNRKRFSCKYDLPSMKDFKAFLPPVINNVNQLHGLMILGWQLWESNWEDVKISMNMEDIPSSLEKYKIINNLIEKSIGNYIISNKWNRTTITMEP